MKKSAWQDFRHNMLNVFPTAEVPLYDQPLEMSGKRDRKKVERFVQETKKEELNVTGSGVALGDIPYIDAMISVRSVILLCCVVLCVLYFTIYTLQHSELNFLLCYCVTLAV